MCIYVYIYCAHASLYTSVRTYIHTYIHTYIYIHIFTHLYISIHIYTYLYISMHVYALIIIYICLSLFIYVKIPEKSPVLSHVTGSQSAACLTALVEASVRREKCSTGRKASWPPGTVR